MKETTKDFRDNSIKTHNDFVRLLQDNLKSQYRRDSSRTTTRDS
ncbi:DUF334 domain-containing protein [Staphylococcus epidermidis]|nr:DUF334 domain-containing protein [Staphylococcus epidermidis]